ncbi:MAG: GNAT family N-acetyltransferase [Deltaproteobacteria bacterium]|nr:GNAT family N-acetyltransferase [Deltaproteobacteria bacterium]
MNKIKLRYQQVSDARKFWEILNHPDFIYFPNKPKTIKDEIDYLRLNREKRKNNLEYNFSITIRDDVVGAIGVMIDQRRPHIGEIGYFIDRKHWGKGIASRSVKLVEEFIEQELHLHRIEIKMNKKNKGSVLVAEKCGYRKEGIQIGKLSIGNEYADAYSYAKVVGKNP